MATLSNDTYRIDPVIRAQSEALFSKLGMSLGTAIHVFLKKALRVGGFPFDVSLETPTRETLEAMIESEMIAKDSSIEAMGVDEALEALKR